MALSHSHSLLHPRIDAHLHFWRYSAGDYPWIGADMRALAVDRTPGHLLPQLSACGFTGAIAVQARATVDETRFLLELARRNDWIRGVVGWEDLTCEGLGERLQDWRAEPRLCGWRHQVQDEPDAAAFLGCAAFGRGMALLQRQGWAYDLLVFHHQMEAAAAFCARHDAHWLVLDHLGKPPLAVLARENPGRIRPLAGAAGAFCRAAACGLQALGPSDRGRLARRAGRGRQGLPAALSRYGLAGVRSAAADVWLRLAGLPAGRAIRHGL